jgi:hypothetical protein
MIGRPPATRYAEVWSTTEIFLYLPHQRVIECHASIEVEERVAVNSRLHHIGLGRVCHAVRSNTRFGYWHRLLPRRDAVMVWLARCYSRSYIC